jgi:hypothetical protein
LLARTRANQVLIGTKPRSIAFLKHFFFTKPVSTFVRIAPVIQLILHHALAIQSDGG